MRLSLLIPACALAACSPQAANTVTAVDNTTTLVNDQTNATSAPLNPPAPGTLGGLDNDMTPVSEAPFTPDSAQGAANVVQTYYALVEEGKYVQAYKLWEPGSAGMPDAFAASFAKYSEVHANIGAPGDVEPDGNQRYVTVPVQFYGRLKADGTPFNLRGSVTLHSTTEQKTWHIRTADLKPLGKADNP